MISWHDLYTVLSAVVPLYVAMILAYGSVRWWGVITPEQCGGINRFVAVFAVPLLSFQVISTSDLYAMNLRFVAADTLQKLIVLAALAAGSHLLPIRRFAPLDWSITFFSLSTLPNTLIMGIPLLVAMYGPYTRDLMVQLVVLQCIVWYTLLLFLFEFRAARVLIAGRFPDTAASIAAVRVDPDVVSLEGSQAVADVAPDGSMRITVCRSTLCRRSGLVATPPRASDLSGAEIYSVPTSSPRGSSFSLADLSAPPQCVVRASSFGAGDLFSLHSSRHHTPRPSASFDEHTLRTRSASAVAPFHDPNPKALHMFDWTSGASQVRGLRRFDLRRAHDSRRLVPSDAPSIASSRLNRMAAADEEELDSSLKSEARQDVLDKLEAGSTTELQKQQQLAGKEAGGESARAEGKQMPPAGVMLPLILRMVWRRLIRNPNTYASIVGLIWSLIEFRFHISMPIILKNSISILSDAGLGMAMFSLGLFMAIQPKIIACGNKVAAVTMAVRFLLGPAVMASASLAVGLRGTLLWITIIQAALPQGIVPFVFAKEYNLHATIVCTGVIFGMLIALPIALVYYIVLGLL